MSKRREATPPREIRISVPWYEGTLFWGSLGLAAALVLAVIAVDRDLRWLLIPAWLFACLTAWAAFRSVQPPRVAWLLIIGFWAIAAGGLSLVSVKVVTYVAHARESRALGSRFKPLTESPDNLMQIYKGRTGVQADKLAATYIGKWIAVSGDVAKVDDVTIFEQKTMVMFLLSDKLSPTRDIAMVFDDKADELGLLHPGSHIKVVGQINKISETSLTLYKCELIEP